MDDQAPLGQETLAAQPFSRLIDAQLTAFRHGYAEVTVPISPDLLQQHGFVHGGVIGYAADNALTFAGGAVLGPAVLTAEYKINFLKPARGERLVARANVIHAGTRQAVCRREVWVQAEGGETLCALALGTIVVLTQPLGRL